MTTPLFTPYGVPAPCPNATQMVRGVINQYFQDQLEASLATGECVSGLPQLAAPANTEDISDECAFHGTLVHEQGCYRLYRIDTYALVAYGGFTALCGPDVECGQLSWGYICTGTPPFGIPCAPFDGGLKVVTVNVVPNTYVDVSSEVPDPCGTLFPPQDYVCPWVYLLTLLPPWQRHKPRTQWYEHAIACMAYDSTGPEPAVLQAYDDLTTEAGEDMMETGVVSVAPGVPALHGPMWYPREGSI